MAAPALVLENRYRLDDRIAVGGMGEVWRAEDLLLDRTVAVKLLRPEYARDESGLARFRAEARYAASLSHPNIAQIYDYGGGEPPAQPYLVMELVDGPSLAALLAGGPLDAIRTLEVISQTAAGLQAAHGAGLVHRDVKPGNLLAGAGGQIKIADFGIAHAVGSAPVTRTGELVGTPAYLSPEQVAGAHATPASDLYALGIVAYQCLTGEVPFTGEPLAVALAHQERNLPPLPSSVPVGVAALVAALTAKDPRGRPAGAGQVAQRADRLRAGLAAAPGAGAAAGITLVFPAAAPYVPPTMVDLPAGNIPPSGNTPPSRAALPSGNTPASGDAPPAPAAADSVPSGNVPAGNVPAAAGPASGSPAGDLAGSAGPGGGPLPAGEPLPAGPAADSPAAGPAPAPAPAGPGNGPARRRFPRALAGLPGLPATLPRRAVLVLAGLAVFGLTAWALSSLPRPPAHQRVMPPPAARPSGPVLGSAVTPGTTPTPQAVDTPAPASGDTPGPHRPSARPPTSPIPSAPVSPTPTQPAPPSPSGQPTPSASASASPSPSPSSTAAPASG